jgi:NADH:ubiquinone oxidoreductase subunit F (NADH-binding)
VLEGIALCAYSTGASEAWIYLIEDMADALASARAAIDEARGAGLLGPSVLGTSFALEVRLAAAPTTYVAGEETAALEVIEGRKAWPRKKPPYPGVSGLFGKPTTVNNLETLAAPHRAARAAWFRALGGRRRARCLHATSASPVRSTSGAGTYGSFMISAAGAQRARDPRSSALSSSFLPAPRSTFPSPTRP